MYLVEKQRLQVLDCQGDNYYLAKKTRSSDDDQTQRHGRQTYHANVDFLRDDAEGAGSLAGAQRRVGKREEMRH